MMTLSRGPRPRATVRYRTVCSFLSYVHSLQLLSLFTRVGRTVSLSTASLLVHTVLSIYSEYR
jgi:hypothetical protein